MCIFAKRSRNLRGAYIGLFTMLYYIVVNLNPFMRENIHMLMQDIFFEYFATVGIYLMIIANSMKDKDRDEETEDPKEMIRMQRIKTL
jgi:choline kinase